MTLSSHLKAIAGTKYHPVNECHSHNSEIQLSGALTVLISLLIIWYQFDKNKLQHNKQ